MLFNNFCSLENNLLKSLRLGGPGRAGERETWRGGEEYRVLGPLVHVPPQRTGTDHSTGTWGQGWEKPGVF